MNTFLKFTLTLCLVSLGFTIFAQTAKINNSTSSTTYILSGYRVKFEASGCPTTSNYVWEYKVGTTGSYQSMVGDWDIAYGTGSGGVGNPITATTPELNIPFNANQTPLIYRTKCKDITSGDIVGTSATITIISKPSNYKPDAVEATRIKENCTSVSNVNSGGITLNAWGCQEGSIWYAPNGQEIPSATNELRVEFSNPSKFTEGVYQVVCKYPNADVPEGSPLLSNKNYSKYIKRAYLLDKTPNITGTGKYITDSNVQEICKDTYNTLTGDLPNSYLEKFSVQWLKDGSGLIGSAAVAPYPNTNTMQASVPGKYILRVRADEAVCGGTRESNTIEIKIVDLPKPTIAGNTSYCLEGTTSLSVNEASLTQNVGYLGVTKPASYTWYVNGVADANLGTSASITLNKNVKIQVGYVSNANCPSDLSSEVAVVNYERPATPTITAKTKLGFCEGTPIAAILESSKNASGGTIYEWSTTATTASINIDKAGSYTVRVKDDNGCYSLTSAATEVKVLPLPAAPVIAANSATIFCTKSDAGVINAVSITATSINDVTWNTTYQGKVLADVKTSGTYSATAKDANGCISVVSNSVKVVNQPNPGLGSASIAKEGVYNLKALNFPATDGSGTAGDFEWKYGSTILNSKVAVAKVISAGDYTARRKYNYTIDGKALTCFTDVVKYAYGVDPEFKGVAIYPNPITGSKVSIQTLEDWTNADVTLYDMVGRPVYSGKLGSTELANELNVNGLGNGIYIVQIKGSGDKSFISKVIVNK